VLRRRYRRNRVELEKAQTPDRFQHTTRGAVERLRSHGDAPRIVAGDFDWPGRHILTLSCGRACEQHWMASRLALPALR
jgi:hypothetical protein